MPSKVKILKIEWDHHCDDSKGAVDLILPEQDQSKSLAEVSESTPYLYVQAEVTQTDIRGEERTVKMEVQLKFDEEGLVLDVFDEISQQPDSKASTYLEYVELYTEAELEEASDDL